MHRTLLPLALLGVFAMPAAQAQSTHLSIQGTYAIQVLEGNNVRGCLVNGDAHATSTPVLYDLGAPGCNAGPGETFHLWDVYNIGLLHVIRSRVNGYCLIRGQNGHAARPTLYQWGLNADKTYCGLIDAHQLIDNGQALWDLNALARFYNMETWLPMFEGPIRLPEFPNGHVTFDATHFPLFSSTPGAWRLAFITKPPR